MWATLGRQPYLLQFCGPFSAHMWADTYGLYVHSKYGLYDWMISKNIPDFLVYKNE